MNIVLICSVQILLGIFIPFTIVALDFKSKEELQLLPQTVEEHIEELEGSDDESTDDNVGVDNMEAIDTDSIIEVCSAPTVGRNFDTLLATVKKA